MGGWSGQSKTAKSFANQRGAPDEVMRECSRDVVAFPKELNQLLSNRDAKGGGSPSTWVSLNSPLGLTVQYVVVVSSCGPSNTSAITSSTFNHSLHLGRLPCTAQRPVPHRTEPSAFRKFPLKRSLSISKLLGGGLRVICELPWDPRRVCILPESSGRRR